MYIKFCRAYGGDKKDEVKDSLSPKFLVELEGDKEIETNGNARPYCIGCLLLTILCLILLVVVIILSMKIETGSMPCPERPTVHPEIEGTEEGRSGSFSPTCSYEQCQDLYPDTRLKKLGCSQCASGWKTYGRSCFYLSTHRLSWEESQKNCSGSGGSLAIISSQRMQNFLTKEGNLKYWIGLRHKGDTWTWVNNSMMHQSYWAEDQSSGDCGIIDSTNPRDKNWMRASCELYTYFICQLQF